MKSPITANFMGRLLYYYTKAFHTKQLLYCLLYLCEAVNIKTELICLSASILFTPFFFLCALCCYRSVVVPVKKPPPGSLAVNTVGAASGGSLTPGTTPNIFAATGATPKSMINTTGICSLHFIFHPESVSSNVCLA